MELDFPTNLDLVLPISPDSSNAKRAIFCEVFAACGRLSRFAQSAGFAILAVDGPYNKHVPECPILNLDLLEEPMQDCLLQVLQNIQPACIHVALPCSTGSRAREKPLPKRLKQAGAPEPRQLRDHNYVLGFPDLTPSEHARVAAANEFAKFTIRLFAMALQLHAIFSVENPLNSWMWLVLTYYAHLLLSPEGAAKWDTMHQVEFSNCAHGGERPKMTMLRCTHPCLASMSAQCPGNHSHQP